MNIMLESREPHFQDVKRDGRGNYEWAPRNRLKIQVRRVREPYIMGRARFPRHLGHNNKRRSLSEIKHGKRRRGNARTSDR